MEPPRVTRQVGSACTLISTSELPEEEKESRKRKAEEELEEEKRQDGRQRKRSKFVFSGRAYDKTLVRIWGGEGFLKESNAGLALEIQRLPLAERWGKLDSLFKAASQAGDSVVEALHAFSAAGSIPPGWPEGWGDQGSSEVDRGCSINHLCR